MLETLREDLGYGLRALARTPATLALGIVFLQYHLFDDLTVGKKVMALPAAQREGTTIVQVTHSEENARAGSRVVQMRDGWIVQ